MDSSTELPAKQMGINQTEKGRDGRVTLKGGTSIRKKIRRKKNEI
jgi:hypothetical protein